MHKEASEKKWASVTEIASHLGVQKSTVYSWVSGRRIPYYKRGHLLRFNLAEVDEWLEDARVETLAEKLKSQLTKE